jgi:hypothetical protein
MKEGDRSSGQGTFLWPGLRESTSIERHDGVGERVGGVLKGAGSVKEVQCLGIVSGLEEVCDPLHLTVKYAMKNNHSAVFRCPA